MMEEFKPNIPLMPATMAVRVRYLTSGLHGSLLAKDQHGELSKSDLRSADEQGDPYPLVSGADLLGKNLVVPLTMKSKSDEITFKEAVVNVSREKTIVVTSVLNGMGTVKEMVTNGDLKLSIQLAVVSNTTAGYFDGELDDDCPIYDTYPYNGVERVRKMLDETCRIDIVSDFLKPFDLDGGDFGIVVESYSIKQETHTNRQVIDIEAVSDYKYDLLIER